MSASSSSSRLIFSAVNNLKNTQNNQTAKLMTSFFRRNYSNFSKNSSFTMLSMDRNLGARNYSRNGVIFQNMNSNSTSPFFSNTANRRFFSTDKKSSEKSASSEPEPTAHQITMHDTTTPIMPEILPGHFENNGRAGVEPLTNSQLRKYAIQCAVPMVGFGLMDNFIMITIGDIIDCYFGAFLTTLTAAACGQCCSDVCGTTFGGVVDALAAKAGMADAKVSPAQADLPAARIVRTTFMMGGVVCGCILGMFPLLFIDTKRNERAQQQKELRTLFRSVAEEGQKTLNVERCSLYLDDSGDGRALWALAKKWTPSRAQIEDCKMEASIHRPDGIRYSIDVLQHRFKKLGFESNFAPFVEEGTEYIDADELPILMNKVLSASATGGKLQKKKIREGGTKNLVLTSGDKNAVLNIRDVYEEERFLKSRKYKTGKEKTKTDDVWRAHSVLVAPVLRGDKIVGCIEMINKKSGDDLSGEIVPFTKGDERLMRLLCGHCGIFLNQLDDSEDIASILGAEV